MIRTRKPNRSTEKNPITSTVKNNWCMDIAEL
jgi:hypothetical protein